MAASHRPDAVNPADLAQLFKVLANDNRLRMLHAIHLGGGVGVERRTDVGCEVVAPRSLG